MNFFRERKKIKAPIEAYVNLLKRAYGTEDYFPLAEVCQEVEIELLENEYIYTVKAFKFENGKRGGYS